jgi:hypothetical protein
MVTVGGGASAEAHYWAALARGEIALPRCAGCARWQWPAVSRCGACGSWEQSWQTVAPRGAIFTWTRTWHAFAGLEALPRPFVSLVVALDDAPARLLGILDRGDVPRIGARVSARIAATSHQGREIPALRWRLTESAS